MVNELFKEYGHILITKGVLPFMLMIDLYDFFLQLVHKVYQKT